MNSPRTTFVDGVNPFNQKPLPRPKTMGRKAKITDEDLLKIKALRDKSVTWTEIEKKFSYSKNTMRHALMGLGPYRKKATEPRACT